MQRFLVLILIGVLLAACDQAAAPQPAATQRPQGGTTPTTAAYPAPQSAYPAPSPALAENGYPAPNLPEGPQFMLDTPVRTTDTQVTGKGPAGVPIKLINVARSAETIGETTIGSDGIFKVDVPTKLIAGDRIALMLGNTAGTKFNPNDFLRGPGYQDYPLVGILFTSTVVE